MSALRTVITCLLVALLVGPAHADDLSRARAHFEVGSGLYQIHRYDDAIREFSAGYALTKRPLFLLNIAQCDELLGRTEQARDAVKQYLAEETPRAPERASALELLHRIEAEIAAAPPRVSPEVPREPSVAAIQLAPVAPEVVVTAPVDDGAAHRHRRAIGLGLGLGAAALVTAGVIIGLVIAFPRHTTPATDLGSVRFGP